MLKGRSILGLTYVMLLSVIGLEAYAQRWEQRQPINILENPIIVSVDTHPYGLHKTSPTVRVLVEGEDRPIDFPMGSWDVGVGTGRLDGELVVRPSFRYGGLLDELDGLRVVK